MKYSAETAHLIHDRALQHLRRFARDPGATCQTSILLKGGFLYGLKFELGPFVARWQEPEDTLRCFRDGQPILTVPLNENPSSEQGRAA